MSQQTRSSADRHVSPFPPDAVLRKHVSLPARAFIPLNDSFERYDPPLHVPLIPHHPLRRSVLQVVPTCWGVISPPVLSIGTEAGTDSS